MCDKIYKYCDYITYLNNLSVDLIHVKIKLV